MYFISSILSDTTRSAITDSLNAIQSINSAEIAELKTKLAETAFNTNNLWMLIATALIFLMHLGFACVETGLVRSKNANNILFKTTFAPVIAVLTFSAWGYALMFPENSIAGFIGIGKLGIPNSHTSEVEKFSSVSFYTVFLFNAMLAGISATIVSGAVAERIKFSSYLIFCFLFTGFIFPIIGSWHSGNGWLTMLTPMFYDFAGASIVHITGGMAALVGAAMLGPRIGKYQEERIMPIMGHNIPLAGIGMFMLWFGCIGFNGGAILASQPHQLSYVIINTFISATAGYLGAFLISYFINRKHDVTMAMNGILAGLVAISASANIMDPLESFIIGLISGLFVIFSVLLFDKFKIDDPVGAISVHFICGIWGTLAVGIFGPFAGKAQLVSQLIGTCSIALAVFACSYVVFFIIKKTIGLRVSVREEREGIDLTSHGMKAYNPDLEI